MIRDLTQGTKETKQGMLVLVQVHVNLFTTTRRPSESVEACYKTFCARRDTVNAHGSDARFHTKLYAMARTRIIAEKGRDESYMTSTASNETALSKKMVIKKQARKACCKQFLAAHF